MIRRREMRAVSLAIACMLAGGRGWVIERAWLCWFGCLSCCGTNCTRLGRAEARRKLYKSSRYTHRRISQAWRDIHSKRWFVQVQAKVRQPSKVSPMRTQAVHAFVFIGYGYVVQEHKSTPTRHADTSLCLSRYTGSSTAAFDHASLSSRRHEG